MLKVYLVDGTYELFRHYYAVPKARDAKDREVAQCAAYSRQLWAMITRV